MKIVIIAAALYCTLYMLHQDDFNHFFDQDSYFEKVVCCQLCE